MLILYCSSMLNHLYPATLACVLVLNTFVLLLGGESTVPITVVPALAVQQQLCVLTSTGTPDWVLAKADFVASQYRSILHQVLR